MLQGNRSWALGSIRSAITSKRRSTQPFLGSSVSNRSSTDGLLLDTCWDPAPAFRDLKGDARRLAWFFVNKATAETA